MKTTLDALRRVFENVSPKVPKELRPIIEVEFKKVADEVGLRENVLNCTSCSLHETCTHKVPGIGPVPCDIMFVGESPGAEEEAQGAPFVGPGGQLLSKAIEAIGWKRDQIYITNILKCHPPGNRQPHIAEITACYQHLQKEIEIVKPKVIICWGNVAANVLIHPDFKMKQEHGHWFEQDNARLIATFSPSYIVRLGEGSERQNDAKWEVFKTLEKVEAYKKSGYSRDHL